MDLKSWLEENRVFAAEFSVSLALIEFLVVRELASCSGHSFFCDHPFLSGLVAAPMAAFLIARTMELFRGTPVKPPEV